MKRQTPAYLTKDRNKHCIPIKQANQVKLECTFPISSSPPNDFMNNLEKRIGVYHQQKHVF